jgi:hypothetical protein
MAGKTLLEAFVAQLNANVFLREFAFSSTALRVPGQGQVEIADHLVLLGDLGLIYQLKERDSGAAHSLADVESWFSNKVKKKAVKQIKSTRDLLGQYRGTQLVNDRGHPIAIDVSSPEKLVAIVIYRVGAVPGFNPPRFTMSRSAGFVHFINDDDYLGVCRFLITPTEIVEYFTFRERILTKESPETVVSEQALLGQFLVGDGTEDTDPKFERALLAMRENVDDWELSYITENLGSQIAYRAGDRSETSYYKILAQLALLSRSELREFKTRLRLTLEAVRADRFELPYRMAVPRNDCGFLLFAVPREMRGKSRTALHNFSFASKHELKVTKHIGLAASRFRKKEINLEWMYIEQQCSPDPELDRMLRRNYPFRRVREKMLPRYLFDSDDLRRELGEFE